MIIRILNAAVAAAVLTAFGSAQEEGAPSRPEPRAEQGRQGQGEQGQQGEQGKQAEQAQQEQRPGETEELARDRAMRQSHFARQNPELAQRLFQQADGDRDGTLTPEERQTYHKLLQAQMHEHKDQERGHQRGERGEREERGERVEKKPEQAGERREGRQERADDRRERRDERVDERRERRADRADRRQERRNDRR